MKTKNLEKIGLEIKSVSDEISEEAEEAVERLLRAIWPDLCRREAMEAWKDAKGDVADFM